MIMGYGFGTIDNDELIPQPHLRKHPLSFVFSTCFVQFGCEMNFMEDLYSIL